MKEALHLAFRIKMQVFLFELSFLITHVGGTGVQVMLENIFEKIIRTFIRVERLK